MGSLICTAALELSANQVTHFYSNKNTAEMIKMLEVLVAKYRDQDRIYLSWDAASWHASKAFIKRVDSINARRVNPASPAPRVELAPLPGGAQFLNVIESVFSGRKGLATRFEGLPDVHYGNEQHFVDEDANTSMSKWLLTGTTPKGTKAKVQGCDFYTFRDDGKVIRKDSYWKIVD